MSHPEFDTVGELLHRAQIWHVFPIQESRVRGSPTVANLKEELVEKLLLR
jgi:hypothetical protein